jgi:catechol 2,3-dioxygenase-like lactoylglutathione lyase family enzyme
MSILTGTEIARPFVPAKDYEVSRDFYVAIGFELLLDSEVAIFACGRGSGFILQRFYVEQHAGNFMMQLMVDDLDAWSAKISALDLPGRFDVPAPTPPAEQPWGVVLSYMVDPTGVLWHVSQRRPNKPWD